MSGIVSGVDYGMLFSPAGATDPVGGMLGAIFSGGNAPASTSVSTGNPLTDLKLAQQNKAADVAREAKLPQVARDIAAFTKAANGAKTIQDALANPNVMKVFLTANNLANLINEPALARKALLSDPADPKALVNKLGNFTLSNTAKSFAFATKGLAALQNPSVISSLANGYAEVMWRQSLNKATPGLSYALTFLGQASAIKKVDDILGDATNREVVLTALGIPKQIAFQDLTGQEQAVASRVTIANFQKPSFVQSLTNQYLLKMQQQARADGPSTPDLSALAVKAGGLVV